MICTVKYYDDNAGAYAGREYTYRTDLELYPLVKVIAPVGNPPEMKKAIVIKTNLPESVIDPEWADRVQTITEVDHA